MRNTLKLGEGFALPHDAVTQTFVAYGGKGMGKTNLLAVVAEELYRAGLRFSVLDPVGVSWGLQYGADRSRRGLGVLVVGGVHGDLPIEPSGGAVVADLVADEDVSVVVDISRRADGRMWSHGEKIRFVADYCTRLYERQGERRRPILQMIDEAGRFCPQMIPHGSPDLARCVGAIEQMVELGRNVGIGTFLVTQRSARMAKSVSELAECMVAFRTIGPNSMGAVTDWLGSHVEKEKTKEMVAQLRSLPRGSALVVSPGWLEREGVVAFRARETFDSSATPRPGATQRAPGKAEKPDLAKYQERMAATVERAQAEDPRILRGRVAELQKKITDLEEKYSDYQEVNKANGELSAALAEARQKSGKREVASALRPSHFARAEALIRQASGAAEDLKVVAADMERSVAAAKVLATPPVYKLEATTSVDREKLRKALAAANIQPLIHVKDEPLRDSAVPSSIPPRQTRILNALFLLEGIGISPAGTTRVGLTAGTSPNSSRYGQDLAALKKAGLITAPQPTMLMLMEAGRRLADARGVPQTSEALQDYFIGKLPPRQQKIMRAVLGGHPDTLSRESVAERVQTSKDSSRYGQDLSYLNNLGLIEYPQRGMVRASGSLFLER